MDKAQNMLCDAKLPSIKNRWVIHIVLFMVSVFAHGQNPGWTPPVGSGYNYSSSVISYISLNGTRSNDADDRIAFFLGEELRGMSKPVSLGNGQYIHFITLFSNTDSEYLSIKIFHKNTNQVYNVLSPFLFRVQHIYGSVDNPFALNIYPADIAPFSILGVAPQHTIQGWAFEPVNMAAYLVQVNPKPGRMVICPKC